MSTDVKILRVPQDNQKRKEILKKAASMLRDGKLVAFPTETVYGLGVNLLNEKAVAKLYRVKQRSLNKPIPVAVADCAKLFEHVSVLEKTIKMLIDRFLPGPLTILLLADKGPFKGKKIAFRMPANDIARELVQQACIPVGATSANVSGEPSPLSASEVVKSLGDQIDLILDGGPVKLAQDSTIVDLTMMPPVVIREGPVKKEDIENVFHLGTQ